MQYDVRGLVPSVAEVISQDLRSGKCDGRAFEKVFFFVSRDLPSILHDA